MKLGLCTGVKNIESAIELGYDYVVLSGTEISAMSEAEFAGLEEKIITCEIPVFAFNGLCPPTVDIAGPDYSYEISKVYAEKLIKRGSRLGIRNIGIGSPKSRIIPAGYSRKDAWNNARCFISTVADEAESCGMLAAVEELTYKYCNCINTLEESRLMMEAVNKDNVGIIIDFFHMEADGYPAEAAADYIKYAYDIHISGIDKDRVPGRPFVGMNDLAKLQTIARLLAAHGYNKTVTLEPDPCEGNFREKAGEALQAMQAAFND